MQSDILSSVLGGLTEAIVGALLGFFFAYLLFRVRRPRKVVDHRVMSTRLLPYRPAAEPILTVSIDKYALTGDEADKGEHIPASNAHAFEIELLNAGNEPIAEPLVEMRLDKRATIVQGWTDPPSRPGYEVHIERDDSEYNVSRVSVPFLNPKGTLTIGLTSVGGVGSTCRVQVIGPGVVTRSRGVYRVMLAAIAKPGLSFALTLGLFAGVEWALRQGLLSSSFGAAIGAQVTTELTRTTTVQMPWWWYAIFVLSGIVMSVWTSSAVSRELLVERYGFGVKSVRFRRVLKRILGLAD